MRSRILLRRPHDHLSLHLEGGEGIVPAGHLSLELGVAEPSLFFLRLGGEPVVVVVAAGQGVEVLLVGLVLVKYEIHRVVSLLDSQRVVGDVEAGVEDQPALLVTHAELGVVVLLGAVLLGVVLLGVPACVSSVELHGVISLLDSLGIARDVESSVEDLPAELVTHTKLSIVIVGALLGVVLLGVVLL